jgi:FecR-like protein
MVMRQVIRFLTAAVFGVAGFASSAPLFAQQGYVHEVSGTVRGQVGSGQPASVGRGMTLPVGSAVTTEANSYAVLKFEDGTVVLLKENTSFQVQSYSYNPKAAENSNAVFNLLRGGLRLVTGLVTSRNRDSLRVATPHATIGIRGTEFTAELINPLVVGVQVGAVSLTNAAGSMLVGAGQFASVASSTTLGSLVSASQLGGALQFPNVPLPTAAPLPGPPPPGPGPIGAGTLAGAGVGATAAVVGAAAAAGVAASGGSSSTTTHHAP